MGKTAKKWSNPLKCHLTSSQIQAQVHLFAKNPLVNMGYDCVQELFKEHLNLGIDCIT